MRTIHARRREASLTTFSHWNPRSHYQDRSIKAHDFAYVTGAPDPTAIGQAIETLRTLVVPLVAQPLLLQTLLLIFGGCCSNVYTLESILTLSPATGTLITCLQFLIISIYCLPGQLTFHVTSSPVPPPLKPTRAVWLPRLKSRRVPLSIWAQYAAQFVLINVLNNAAFGYKISLPLHIILRSAGPVASMLVGRLWVGKRYSSQKTLAVLLLFAGVVLAALSDAGEKKPALSPIMTGEEGLNRTSSFVHTTNSTRGTNSMKAPTTPLFDQAPGFALLTLALFLSAGMGIWSDGIYNKYGRTPKMANEQLFYGHLLSLPFFLFRYHTLSSQWTTLKTASAGFRVQTVSQSTQNDLFDMSATSRLGQLLRPKWVEQIPKAMIHLALNCMTQVACISGVHRLSTQTSALTVSIVLNVRKVISLLLSIYLFGNDLRLGVLVGAAIVFIGGGLYGLPERKTKKSLPTERDIKTETKKKQ